MASVSFKNLSFKFATNTVFKNLSLEVRDGEILGIVGPSGCGKTTLIRCLAGLINPEEGEIAIDDNLVYSKEARVNIQPERRKIGMVFQDYAVWPHKSVWQNVEYPLAKQKVSKQDRASKIEYALQQVRMESYAQHMPVQLSGGQQQRVAIARALVASNDVIILDEPITNLDAKLREEMIVEIQMLQKQLGTTIIYITHDQEAALHLCDRIAIMNDKGEIVQVGTDEEIILHPANRFVFEFIGVSNFLEVIKQDDQLYFINQNPKSNLRTYSGANTRLLWPGSQLEMQNLSNLAEGVVYDMGIRPHNIIFNPNSQLKATVLRSVFLGNQYTYFLDFAGQELRVHKNSQDFMNEKEYESGAEVGISFSEPVFYEKGAKTCLN